MPPDHVTLNTDAVILENTKLSGCVGTVDTELFAEELDPPELTAVTTIVYVEPPDKPVNDANFELTPLSVEGVVVIPFREYV